MKKIVSVQDRATFYNKAFPQYPDSHFQISDRWISATWITGNNYRGSGFYGCLPGDTKVLTADLKWVRQDSLQVGDELVGVTEQRASKSHRKMLPSIVEKIGEVTLPSSRVVFENGFEIIASNTHLWLCQDSSEITEWCSTNQLKPKSKIRRICDVWNMPDNFLSGWVAGILDGEGSASHDGFRVGISQNDGAILDKAIEIITAWGIPMSLQSRRGRPLTRNLRTQHSAAALKLLGMAPTVRLQRKWVGMAFPKLNPFLVVKKIIPVGMQPLIAMTTSTRTFIAEGLVSHNSYPPGYIKRVYSMFPEDNLIILHLFSGSLKDEEVQKDPCLVFRISDKEENGITPDFQLNAEVFSESFKTGVDVIFADPPYSIEDAEHYGKPLCHKKKVLEQCHKVLNPGGLLFWMDQSVPMYSKENWKWVGVISMYRSTNHRIRGVMIFERI